jgi:hypothetical protein
VMSGRDFITRGTTREVVRLVAVQPFVRELAACPHLARLRRLDLTGNRIGPDGARVLAESPHLGGLRELGLNGNAIGADGAAALAAAPWLAGLGRLEVAENGLSAGDVARLLDAVPRLETVDVSGNAMEDVAELLRFREVMASSIGARSVSDEIARPVAHAPGSVRSLDLRHNRIDLLTLLGRVPFPALTRLDLGFNDCGDGGIAALAAGAFPRLRTLSLKANRLTAAGFATLSLGTVESLDLSVNPLGDTGAVAALASFPSVVRLDLSNTALTDAGLRQLVAAGVLLGVRSLHLAWNRLTDPTPLLDLPRLEALDLTGCPVGRRAAVALAARFGTIRG